MPLTPEQVRIAKEEWLRRQAAKVGIADLIARIEGELFDKQVAFYKDTSRFKAVLGSRRAGKTGCWVRVATIKALQNPRTLIRVWHSSRLRCKDMLWAEFKWLHSRHGIVTESNETELSITFENGAVIRLVGADKSKEAEKKRGDKTILEIILEAQNFGSFLRSMIEDVIGPSLLDLMGTLCIEGTPGALCQGVWYEISGGDNHARRWWNQVKDPETGTVVDGEWSCHRWTLLDNPHGIDLGPLQAQLPDRLMTEDHRINLVLGPFLRDLDRVRLRELLRPSRLFPRRERPLQSAQNHAQGRDRRGRLGQP